MRSHLLLLVRNSIETRQNNRRCLQRLNKGKEVGKKKKKKKLLEAASKNLFEQFGVFVS